MKKWLFGLFILIGMIGINWVFAKTTMGNIFETQTFVENTINLSGLRIQDTIPFWIISEILEKECSPSSLEDAKVTIDQLVPIRGNAIPKRKLQIEMQKRFNFLKQIILAINSEDEATFCKQKYITYRILELTQKLFKGESIKSLENKQKAWTKETSLQKSEISSNTTSEALTWDDEHPSAEIKKSYIKLQHNTANLTEKEKKLAQITEKSIQEVISTMIDQKLLKQEDIEKLDGAIHIQYTKTCEKTRGSFHAMKNKSNQEMKFKEIKLNVNLCSSEGFYKHFDQYVKQILTHELGHYIYFFRDKQTENFDQICWNGKQKLCDSWGFFSRYAESNKEEDYAESFAYWYLDSFNGKEKEFWSAPANEAQGKKEFHFTELLKTLK